MSSVIALLTDFGEIDPFVGVMKGVMLSRDPKAKIVDLTHQVPPQHVRVAAFYLMSAVSYFPKNTIFTCVVDPGVGSARRILWARTKTHQFLAPDNGLLSWVERREPFAEIRNVVNRDLFLGSISSTFHGRDIFAPVAGELSRAMDPSRLGPCVHSIKRLAFPKLAHARGRIRGEVLAIDRFGNAVTNIATDTLPAGTKFHFKHWDMGPLRNHYSEVQAGKPVAVAGSVGFVELSVRQGSFAARYGARAGDTIDGNYSA